MLSLSVCSGSVFPWDNRLIVAWIRVCAGGISDTGCTRLPCCHCQSAERSMSVAGAPFCGDGHRENHTERQPGADPPRDE